jgi:hypothetical protein
MDLLFFNNKLNTKSHYLKQLFEANPHHFSKNSDGRTFVMTPSVIQIARSFNYFYLAELCKLTVDELLGKVADPLLKCIDYDQWRMALPAPYKMENHADLELEPLNGNEWFFISSASPEARTIKTEKQYMKPSRNTRM